MRPRTRSLRNSVTPQARSGAGSAPSIPGSAAQSTIARSERDRLQEPGTLIEGKYEIVSKIREGGMGSIYKVRHRLLDEIRVVKVMRPQILADEGLKRRFVEEAKTATRLKHLNICTIHDFALDDDGTAYLVMEYIDGATLAELTHLGKPPGLALSLEIAHQALLALGYLHRRNVVHRDIAPDNLMLTQDEEGRPLVKLIDLGIAKTLDQTGADMTSTGVFLGKLKYASPEQYGAMTTGERVDGRSDLYGLGVVLYELLTGTRPFVGERPAELLRAHLLEPPTPFSETDPQGRVPASLRAAILRALEKKRDDRFATAEEFDVEILRIQREIDPSAEHDGATYLSHVRRQAEKTSITITPSAQNRLDRQFIAQLTPHPSRSGLTPIRGGQDTESTVVVPDKPPARPSGGPIPGAPAGRPGRSIAFAALAVLFAAGVYLLFLRPRGQAPPAARAASASSAAAAAISPTAVPAFEPPTPAAAAIPPAAAPTEPPPARAFAEPTQKPARRPTPEPPPARRPTTVVSRQEVPSERFSAPTPVPPPRNPEGRPDGILRRFSPTPAAVEPAATATEQKNPAPSEQDRIREALLRYERAQNTLDVELYSRVYPGANRARVQSAFDSLRSQTVTLEKVYIEVVPGATRALVRLHERRVAVPQVGSEQRMDGDRVIHLQKAGDNWVITGLE